MSRSTRLTSSLLLKAGRYYHESSNDTDYGDLVFKHGAKRSGELSTAGVRFLAKWGAMDYRQRKTRLRSIRAVLPTWFREYRSVWEPLRKKRMMDFDRDDDAALYTLANSLYRDSGVKSTEFGKLLHFVAPHAVAMWDGKWVRKRYELGQGPREFVFYQRGLRALLGALANKEGRGHVNAIAEKHREQTDCFGDVPKILDEAVYYRPTRQITRDWLVDFPP